MAGKIADKDILETLACLEFAAEMNESHQGIGSSDARNVTAFRRIAREAGYDLPPDFDWQIYLPDNV